MSLPQRITKTHATGNDFVVYLDKTGDFEPTADEIRFLCDRHFGIGGDGLIRLTKPEFVSDLSDEQIMAVQAGDAEWFMDYRNADGSLAEMCGNGTRAITLFAQREGVADSTEPFRLGTRAGVKILTPRGNVKPYGANVFQVEMGEWKIGETDAYEVTIPGNDGSAHGTFVDMGNPHVVAVIEDAFSTLPVVEDQRTRLRRDPLLRYGLVRHRHCATRQDRHLTLGHHRARRHSASGRDRRGRQTHRLGHAGCRYRFAPFLTSLW